MKKSWLSRSALLALCALFCLTLAARAGTTVLKFDMPVPITSSWGVGAERFGKLLAEKTGGKYTLKIFPNSQLAGGSQTQALQMLQAGDIDVTIHGVLT